MSCGVVEVRCGACRGVQVVTACMTPAVHHRPEQEAVKRGSRYAVAAGEWSMKGKHIAPCDRVCVRLSVSVCVSCHGLTGLGNSRPDALSRAAALGDYTPEVEEFLKTKEWPSSSGLGGGASGTDSSEGSDARIASVARAEYERSMSRYKELLSRVGPFPSISSGGVNLSPETFTPAHHLQLLKCEDESARNLADEIGQVVLDSDAALYNMWYAAHPKERALWLGKWVYVVDGSVSEQPYDDEDDAYVACSSARKLGPRCSYVVQVTDAPRNVPRDHYPTRHTVADLLLLPLGTVSGMDDRPALHSAYFR